MATSLKSESGRVMSVQPFVDATDVVDDSVALRRLATTNGYLFFRGLAPRAKVKRLRAEVVAQCARRGWLDDRVSLARAVAHREAPTRATHEQLLWLQGDVQILPVFTDLRGEPAIASVLEAVLGATPVDGCGDVCRIVFPADLERTSLPHQDHFYVRGSTALWTVWIPLGECPPALGGLVVLPGSHERGLLPHDGGAGENRFIELSDDVQWAGTSYRTGDVLMFNTLTVHRARPNVTRNRIRLSADFRFRPLDGADD